MTDVQTTVTGIGGDWAIFPPDRISDSTRWIRLIEEMDKLLSIAASVDESFVHNSIDQQITTNQTIVGQQSPENVS